MLGVTMLDATPQRDRHETHRAETVVRCRACDHTVAHTDDRVRVGDGQLHTFVNPAGEVFELCCFSRADGARAQGEATRAFTWFPGYAWCFAICRACGRQLGWRYTGAASFWGLDRRTLRGV